MRIAIFDDEKEFIELIFCKLKKLCPDEEFYLYSSGDALLAEEYSRLPDILFLDIQMPGRDGMETAKELRGRKKNLILIFITVTEEYVFQAFDVGAFHYLIKPFSEKKLEEVMQKARKQYYEAQTFATEDENYVMVKTADSHTKVFFRDIEYAEVFNRKVILHKSNESIKYYGKLSALAEQAGPDFFRTHRAYLVNFRYIVRYNASTIWLESGGTALVSKQNYSEFVREYLKYNRRERSGGDNGNG